MFEDWIRELGCRPVVGLDRSGLCDVVAGVARLRSAVDAFEAKALAAVEGLDDRGAPASLVARTAGRCSQREADRRARRAVTLVEVPGAAEALAAGRLSLEHLDSIGRAVEATSVEAVNGSNLVEGACRRPVDLHARDTREWIRRQQSDSEVEQVHRRRYAARRLSMFENDDGMVVLHGEFDPVTGAKLRSVVNTATDRLFHLDGGRGTAGDKRTPQQRRADALTELVTGTGSSRETPTVPVRNQMLVVASLTDGEITDGRLVDGSPLAASVIERLACGSDLFGLVMSGDGDPLWMSRQTRLATDAQWRALIARDEGCRICDLDPSKCEAHHIIAWQPPGCGPTNIDNLILLCSHHHHHLVHDRGHKLERLADGEWCLKPP